MDEKREQPSGPPEPALRWINANGTHAGLN